MINPPSKDKPQHDIGTPNTPDPQSFSNVSQTAQTPEAKMEKVLIAFDVDGTVRSNAEERHRTEVEANPSVLDTLKWLAKCKNTEIHLWSNRGAGYCQEMRQALDLQKYIKESHCHQKTWKAGQYGVSTFIPDIAFDDQQRFDGGILNVIVREK